MPNRVTSPPARQRAIAYAPGTATSALMVTVATPTMTLDTTLSPIPDATTSRQLSRVGAKMNERGSMSSLWVLNDAARIHR